MQSKGIKNSFALLGGTQGWKDAGYPMEGEPKKEEPKKDEPKANSNTTKK